MAPEHNAPSDAPVLDVVLLAVVTGGGNEMGAKTLSSILGIQTTLMCMRHPPFGLEIRFVRDTNDAMNLLHLGGYRAALIVRHNAAFDPEFVLRAHASGESIVFGVSATDFDWGRVKPDPTSNESTHNKAIVYNVRLSHPRSTGYANVVGLSDLSVAYVNRTVVDSMAERHPHIVGKNGSAFIVDAVVDGEFVPGLARFMGMHGPGIMADTEHPVTVSTPMAFEGSVGARTYVR